MKSWIIAAKYFYREYTIYNLLSTAPAVSLLIQLGHKSYPYIFWLKILGYVATALAYYWSRKKYFYFFYNLGLSKKDLIFCSVVPDASLTILILLLTNLLLP